MWNFYFTRGSKFCDHSEHFCDHIEAKLIFGDKCGNFTPSRYRIFRVKSITEFIIGHFIHFREKSPVNFDFC